MALGRYVYTPKTTHEQKIAYLKALKKFVETCIDETLMQFVEPRFHIFLEALRKNDLETLAKTDLRRGMISRKKVANVVKARHATTKVYMRPSIHASEGKLSIKPRQALQVYPTVPGWFEIRIAGGEDDGHAEFIQKKDVRLPIKYVWRQASGHMKSKAITGVKGLVKTIIGPKLLTTLKKIKNRV